MDEHALCEALVEYLSGEKMGGFEAQEIYRQLSKRLLSSLPDSEEFQLRESPGAHRAQLLHVLSQALQEDPVVRRLAGQLTSPETKRFPDRRASAQSSRGDHIEIRGDGNLLAHGNFGDGNVFATGPMGNGNMIGGNGNVGGQGNRLGSGHTVESRVSQMRAPHPFSSGFGEPRPHVSEPRPASSAPIRLLFLTAAPTGQAPLRTDQEIRDVQEALRQSEFRDRFDPVQEVAVRLGDFQRAILRHKPDILHFSGHGFGGAISLEGQDGTDWPVEGCDIADLFSILQGKTRCVVLNACYTAEQADLIAQKVDTVIARPDAVRDSAARTFSVYFYQALGFGSSVREAFDLACLQLRLEGWGTSANPVLLAKRCDPAEVRFAQP